LPKRQQRFLRCADCRRNWPRRLKRLGTENLFLKSYSNHYVIRRVDKNGIILTVAGNRNGIYSGEGVSATQASFGFPAAVALDATGNIYIADSPSNRVRRVGTDGIIRTLAGTGDYGSTGDGALATQAQIREPKAIAVDKARGLLYFLETPASFPGAFIVRQVDLSTGIIHTISGSASDPASFALDSTGNIVVFKDRQFWRLNPVTGNKSAIAQINPQNQVAVAAFSLDQSGNIYIADPNSNLILRIGQAGQAVTFAGGGTIPRDGLPAIQAVIYDSQGLAFDAFGNLFISDFDHNQIRKVDHNGIISTVAGIGRTGSGGDGGHPLQASFNQPLALAFDPRGNLLFLDLDHGTGTVRLISNTSRFSR
jgi:hypothetical protein